MLVRGPVVVLLCVAWPVAAPRRSPRKASEAFRRITGWLLSWTIYKLAAAIVYATAFAMFGDSKDAGRHRRGRDPAGPGHLRAAGADPADHARPRTRSPAAAGS